METTFYQSFSSDDLILVGISNTNNQSLINSFIEENSLTFPIIFDSGSPGGVQGGNVYDDYYLPNDGSPYPRDFIIDQLGTIQYANNEIDTELMLYIIESLIYTDSDCTEIAGDLNFDSLINILDIVSLVNIVLEQTNIDEIDLCVADLNQDSSINILDIVQLVNLVLGN